MDKNYYTIKDLMGLLRCQYQNVITLTNRGLLLYHGKYRYPKTWNAERIHRLLELRTACRRKWMRAF
jgi:hypothetical protein